MDKRDMLRIVEEAGVAWKERGATEIELGPLREVCRALKADVTAKGYDGFADFFRSARREVWDSSGSDRKSGRRTEGLIDATLRDAQSYGLKLWRPIWIHLLFAKR